MSDTPVFIQRPALPATGYTALPNWLFECKTLKLKARDLVVLKYLLSKPQNWQVRVNDIANWCAMSKNTVYAALKVLQQLGIAHWERLKTGRVNWFIHVPDQPASRVVETHTKKTHHNFDRVLTKNNKKPNIEKKTTEPPNKPTINEQPLVAPVVVTEQSVLLPEPTTTSSDITPDLTVLECLDAKEKNIIIKELKKVTDLTTQAVILFTLKTAMANNTIKNSPIALVRGLINKAIEGVLVTKYAVERIKAGQSTAVPMTKDTPHALVEAQLKAERIAKIRGLAAKHPECVNEMKKNRRFVFPSDTRYVYSAYDFIEAGLM